MKSKYLFLLKPFRQSIRDEPPLYGGERAKEEKERERKRSGQENGTDKNGTDERTELRRQKTKTVKEKNNNEYDDKSEQKAGCGNHGSER